MDLTYKPSGCCSFDRNAVYKVYWCLGISCLLCEDVIILPSELAGESRSSKPNFTVKEVTPRRQKTISLPLRTELSKALKVLTCRKQALQGLTCEECEILSKLCHSTGRISDHPEPVILGQLCSRIHSQLIIKHSICAMQHALRLVVQCVIEKIRDLQAGTPDRLVVTHKSKDSTFLICAFLALQGFTMQGAISAAFSACRHCQQAESLD